MVRSSIIKQPSYNSHFHYAAEPNWNKHGCLKDRGNGYPTVVLQLSPEETLDGRGRKREFYLLCSLHNYQNGQRCLSPHLLMLRGNTNDINYKFIFDRMDENPKNDLGRIWRLENAVIARTKKDHQEISLANKYQEFKKLTLQEFDFVELKGDTLDGDLLTVCLGFTIFERDLDTNTFRLFERTFYSENITHGKGLDVIRLCNLSGPIGGGKSITVLATLRQKCNYSIYMYHVNDQGEIDWNCTIESQNVTKRGNAITFDLPQGPLGIDDERILVYLCVIEIRTDNTILSGSKTMKFFYKNYGMEQVAANSNITQSSLTSDYNTNGFVCYNCGTYNHSGLSQLAHPMANACGWRTIAATNPGNNNNSLYTSGEHSHIVPSSSSNQFPGGEYQANTSNVMLIDLEITPSDNPDIFND